MPTITLEMVREHLRYDPETGDFWWIKSAPKRVLSKPAGNVSRGYRSIRIFGKACRANRLAWLYTYGQWPQGHVDHINGDTGDNRIANLREVTNAENAKNAKRRVDNTSGVTGVCWFKPARLWTVHIGRKHVGYAKEFSDAVAMRKQAERDHGYHENHGRVA